MNDKKAEMLRRLDALGNATACINYCEVDFQLVGEHGCEPFKHWPADGEISVIYDRDGKVSHRVVR